jgi:hypothetical protein
MKNRIVKTGNTVRLIVDITGLAGPVVKALRDEEGMIDFLESYLLHAVREAVLEAEGFQKTDRVVGRVLIQSEPEVR